MQWRDYGEDDLNAIVQMFLLYDKKWTVSRLLIPMRLLLKQNNAMKMINNCTFQYKKFVHDKAA